MKSSENLSVQYAALSAFWKDVWTFPSLFQNQFWPCSLENNRMATKQEISKSNLSGVLNLGCHSSTGSKTSPLLDLWKAHNRNRVIKKTNTSFYYKLYGSQWQIRQRLKMISPISETPKKTLSFLTCLFPVKNMS